MAKKRLKIKDKQGNVVDYDISSASVTIDIEGKSLDVKLSEIATALLQAVTEVTFNGTPYNRENGKINLGQQMQADWNENNTNWPAYIRNKPNSVVNEMLYDQQSRKVRQRRNGVVEDVFTLPEEGSQVTFDEQMSSTSENGVQNKVIKAYVDAVSQRIDTLLGSGNVQGAIDTFNEVVAFLNGIDTSDPTLANQLLALNNAIANAGKVKSVSVNGTNHTPDSNGVVDLGTIQGQKGDKGETGNCQITGDGGNIVSLIVNDLTTGGAGNILSAEMGKRLALLAGTYAQAWARSKAIPFPFCWLWVETVDGDAISKPIWHKGNSVFVDAAGGIVNVNAAAVPDAPTITGATSGDTVAKNTQIIITPASGSALYYSIDGGITYQVSDNVVTLTLATAGSVSVVAYCANNAGNSSNASLSVTVAGTAVPTFSQASGEVARGGSVTISVPSGGELHYKVDSGSWITASGTSVSIPITGATTIQAYNVQDGDTSSTITNTYTMATLASPTFSVATGTELPIGGGEVALSAASGATIYYTTDGSTPTTASTQYTGAIQVTDAMTIKAIAVDQWGSSEVATASYTVAVDHKLQFKIALTGDNSTEYVPITNNNGPMYNMTVDWGDGTTTDYSNNGADKVGVKKDCGHTYVGNAGDEFIITIRGTRCDTLVWIDSTCCNPDALVAILDNTLTCDTEFTLGPNSNLTSLCANAFQNNIGTSGIKFQGTALTSLPDGLLSHLTKNSNGWSSCKNMFNATAISLSASQMNELKGAISHVTNFDSMFYGIKASVTIPDDFFDDVQDNSVTRTWGMTNTGGNYVSGDAKKLYDVLLTKMVSGYQSNNVSYTFTATGLSNRAQVPNAWGGTAG